MKIITSFADIDLPMPDGRVLPARGKLRVPDHVAGNERVRMWGASVTVEDYVVPTAEPEPVAKAEDKPAKGKVEPKATDA